MNHCKHLTALKLNKIDREASTLFANGLYRDCAFALIQGHALISRLSGLVGMFQTQPSLDLELRDVGFLMNASMAYLKASQAENAVISESRELTELAHFYAFEGFELLQKFYRVPENITARNISHLYRSPLNLDLLVLFNFLNSRQKMLSNILPGHTTEWTFNIYLINWSK